MIKCIIIDDEFYAREEMEQLLLESGKFEILEKCGNPIEAVKAINQYKPEVIFLDIQLSMLDGFEVLAMLESSVMPRVVFVTAFDEYAVKAFDENAVDYLLKPVDKDRFTKTVERIEKSLAKKEKNNFEIPCLKRIPSVVSKRIKLINVDYVDYVVCENNSVFLICGNTKYFTDLTLKVLEERTKLTRSHKGYLVNPEKIDEIIVEDNVSGKIKLHSGLKIPVSRSYLKIIKEKLTI